MEFEAFSALVRRRRTRLTMDPSREVERATIERLCAEATWAPCHRLTWPWRFAAFTGDARRALGDVAADAMAARGDAAPKVDKTRTKFLRAPVVVVVGSEPGSSDLETAENRDAVAAGVQNFLLGATALGLATFWSSCPKGANDPVARHCGFVDGTHVAAMLYVGWPVGDPPSSERPPAEIRWFC